MCPSKNNNLIIYNLQLIINYPFLVLFSVTFKSIFIVFQAVSIWMFLGWVSTSEILKDGFMGLKSDSIIYPAVACVIFVLSSLMNVISKQTTIILLKKVEEDALGRDYNNLLTIAHLKNFSKLMVATIDAYIPVVFFTACSVVWVIIEPLTGVFLLILFVFLYIFNKVMIKVSKDKIYYPKKRIQIEGYITSNQREKFFSLLLFPHIVTLATYALIAFFVFILSYLSINSGNRLESEIFKIVSIVTFVSLLQLKSMASLVVRVGAYGDSARQVMKILFSVGKKSDS